MKIETIKFSAAEIEFLEARKAGLVAQKKELDDLGNNHENSFEIFKRIMKIDDWIIEDLKNKTFIR